MRSRHLSPLMLLTGLALASPACAQGYGGPPAGYGVQVQRPGQEMAPDRMDPDRFGQRELARSTAILRAQQQKIQEQASHMGVNDGHMEPWRHHLPQYGGHWDERQGWIGAHTRQSAPVTGGEQARGEQARAPQGGRGAEPATSPMAGHGEHRQPEVSATPQAPVQMPAPRPETLPAKAAPVAAPAATPGPAPAPAATAAPTTHHHSDGGTGTGGSSASGEHHGGGHKGAGSDAKPAS